MFKFAIAFSQQPIYGTHIFHTLQVFIPHRNTLSDDGYAFHKLSGNKANLILAKGNSIHSFEMRINGETEAGEYIQRKEKLTEEEQRFESLQNQSEQKEIEVLYTGNEIWGE